MRHARRRELIVRHGGRCSRCGYDRSTAALQFHHRNPSAKQFPLTVSQMYRPMDQLVAEADACDLLCANCHADLEDGIARARQPDAPVRPGQELAVCARHGERPHYREGTRLRCCTCRSQHVIAWYRRRKQQLVDAGGGACSICGCTPSARAMHFHHRDPSSKRFTLSGTGLYRALGEVLVEVAKCDLLCACCHAEVEETASRAPGRRIRSPAPMV